MRQNRRRIEQIKKWSWMYEQESIFISNTLLFIYNFRFSTNTRDGKPKLWTSLLYVQISIPKSKKDSRSISGDDWWISQKTPEEEEYRNTFGCFMQHGRDNKHSDNQRLAFRDGWEFHWSSAQIRIYSRAKRRKSSFSKTKFSFLLLMFFALFAKKNRSISF